MKAFRSLTSRDLELQRKVSSNSAIEMTEFLSIDPVRCSIDTFDDLGNTDVTRHVELEGKEFKIGDPTDDPSLVPTEEPTDLPTLEPVPDSMIYSDPI